VKQQDKDKDKERDKDKTLSRTRERSPHGRHIRRERRDDTAMSYQDYQKQHRRGRDERTGGTYPYNTYRGWYPTEMDYMNYMMWMKQQGYTNYYDPTMVLYGGNTATSSGSNKSYNSIRTKRHS